MKKVIGWFAVLALLAVSFSFVGCATQEERKAASAPAAKKVAAQKKTQSLFIIKRSKNAVDSEPSHILKI